MALNINTTPTKAPVPVRRRRLADALLNELLSWNPREFIIAFRRWHRDSFSLIHLNVLTMLDADGPDSMSHLAEALDVSVASMTGIVDRMEKRGLVERRHGGKDRRVVWSTRPRPAATSSARSTGDVVRASGSSSSGSATPSWPAC